MTQSKTPITPTSVRKYAKIFFILWEKFPFETELLIAAFLTPPIIWMITK